MAKNDIEREIRSHVDAFVAELTTLIRRAAIESVQEAIGGLAEPAPRRGRPRKTAAAAAPSPAPTRRRGRKKRVRRSSADVSNVSEQALSFVRANPGCSVGDIGAALGLSTKELRLPLLKLIADGKLRTTGRKRGTRYHAGRGAGTPKKANKTTRKKKTTRRKKR